MTDQDSTSACMAPGQRLGDFLLVRQVNQYAWGDFFLAEHLHRKKQFGLLVLPQAWVRSPGFQDRFNCYLRWVSQLQHDALCPVDHGFMAEGNPVVVSPWSGAKTLAEHWQSQPEPESTPRILNQFTDWLAGLAAIHQHRNEEWPTQGEPWHGILHPEMVLGLGSGRCQLLFPGLGMLEPNDCRSAPVHRTKADPRSSRLSGQRRDLFAAGMLGIEALTGEPSDGFMIAPSLIRPNLNPQWDNLIAWCCAPHFTKQYPNAQAVLKILPSMQLSETVSGKKVISPKPLVYSSVIALGLLSVVWFGWPTQNNQEPSSQLSSEMTASATPANDQSPVLPTTPEQHQPAMAVKPDAETKASPPVSDPTESQTPREDDHSSASEEAKPMPLTKLEVAETSPSQATRIRLSEELRDIENGLVITINGQRVSWERGIIDRLPSGIIRISVSHPDFESWSKTVTLEHGETLVLPMLNSVIPLPALTPAFLLINATADDGVKLSPDQIKLKANGENPTMRGGRFLLPAEEPVVLMLEANGYEPAEMEAVFIAGGDYTWDITLTIVSQLPPQPGQPWTLESLGMTLAWIPQSSFNLERPAMGPIRKQSLPVSITRGFWMGATPVTRAQFDAVMEEHFRLPASSANKQQFPAVQVSWFDAVAFCEKLNEHERSRNRLPEGYIYRLPTEAEWFAAVMGPESLSSLGQDFGQTDLAWLAYNAGEPQPVGLKQPNRFGLYDTFGNVEEWCLDWFTDRLEGGHKDDPAGPSFGLARLTRGGSYLTEVDVIPQALFSRHLPNIRRDHIGFRVVLAPALDKSRETVEDSRIVEKEPSIAPVSLLPQSTTSYSEVTTERDRFQSRMTEVLAINLTDALMVVDLGYDAGATQGRDIAFITPEGDRISGQVARYAPPNAAIAITGGGEVFRRQKQGAKLSWEWRD